MPDDRTKYPAYSGNSSPRKGDFAPAVKSLASGVVIVSRRVLGDLGRDDLAARPDPRAPH